jgi:hypothetical protein
MDLKEQELDYCSSEYRQVAGFCRDGNELSFCFHKIWEIASLAEKLSASQEGLSYIIHVGVV